jgi:hypothetical protein
MRRVAFASSFGLALLKKTSPIIVATAGLLLSLVTIAPAQTTTSEVSGTVLDSSSAVVPGATVTLRNTATSVSSIEKTNAAGLFVFSGVVPGAYEVKIEASGFKASERRGIEISANEKRSLGSLVLDVGSSSETITVNAQAMQVQTSSGENSSLLSTSQMDHLSTRGRDAISLLKLIPGVTPGNDAESLGGTFGTTLPAVNGQSSGFNQVTLDGQSGTDDDITNAFNETTSMDAIAEVKVLMNNYQAEYGRNASAVINMISKSGTQRFHGSAYWYKRHEEFNADDFFNNRNGVAKPRYRYNTLGGTIGGPIFIPHVFNTAKTKLFFFYSREDQLTYTPQALTTVTMPTALERKGDYSQTLDVSGKLIPITDPTTGQPFPGNVIPSNRINNYGQAMLNIFKLPNFFNRAISGGNYNYQWQQTAEVPKKQNLLKIDYNPTNKDRISLRPRTWWADTRQYNIFGNFQTNWDFYKEHYLFTEDSMEINWTRTLAPTVVNEFSVSFRALHESDPKLSPNQWDPITRSVQGLSGLGQWNPSQNGNNIIPAMSFGGVPSPANINGEVLNRIPIDARDFRYTLVDNLSKTYGQHQFKVGYYYEFNVGSEGPRGNVYGNFSFAKDVNNSLDSNYAYSNALLGNFQSYTESSNQTTARNFFSLTEWFAQDSWKVSHRLTVELGMRFTVAPPLRFPDGDAAAFYLSLYNIQNAPKLIQPTIVNGKRVGLNPVTSAIMPTPAIGFYAPNSGDPLNGLRAASAPGYDHFANGSDGVRVGPRFGFAWDVFGNGKTAVRGGFAITRNPLLSNSSTYGNAGSTTPPAQFNPVLYYGNLNTFTSATGLLSPQSVTTYGPEMKITTVYSSSLSVQRDLGHAIIASVGYVGNRGLHILQREDLNELPYGARFLASSLDSTTGLPLPDNFLRAYPGYGSIMHVEDNGISDYNALQTTLQRRFAKGFEISSGYTWSKAMSNGATRPTYLNARTWFYGKTADDRTHVWTLNFTYQLPSPGKLTPNPVVKGVFDGWELSAIGTFASGAPSGISFTTVSGADLTGGGDGQRVVILGPIVTNSKAFNQWFNTANVGLPAKGSTGNAAPDEFRGPGTNNWDMTAFKNIKVKEKATFQLRWEAYNVFNHTQWATVNSAARFDNSGNQVNTLFGTVTASRSPRVMQGSLRIQF